MQDKAGVDTVALKVRVAARPLPRRFRTVLSFPSSICNEDLLAIRDWLRAFTVSLSAGATRRPRVEARQASQHLHRVQTEQRAPGRALANVLVHEATNAPRATRRRTEHASTGGLSDPAWGDRMES